MSWMRRLVRTFRRRVLNGEIDEELQFHADMRTIDLERAGMTPEAARREARRLLGNDTALRDRTREADVWVRLESALQDARYAVRMLWRAPWFTVAAALTLAIGIGVNTAMFAVVYRVADPPAPVRGRRTAVQFFSRPVHAPAGRASRRSTSSTSMPGSARCGRQRSSATGSRSPATATRSLRSVTW